jgi:hypothetical protein
MRLDRRMGAVYPRHTMIGSRGRVPAIAAILVPIAMAVLIVATSLPRAQSTAAMIPRLPDGTPNLSGIWQVNNTAHWDILTHQARQGPISALGATFSVPGGIGVVDGNVIPYKPEALAKKQENAKNWLTADPEIKCYVPGIPRATYMPYPFQIVQSGKTSDMLMTYEFAAASRIVRLSTQQPSQLDSWMGWSLGRWEGDTLVVDVTGFNGESWFDRAGNYQTNTLHVVERFTLVSPDRLDYEVTIDDPQLYTRPWKMRMPIYRRVEPNAQLVEYKCVEFAEELMYGDLVKRPNAPASKTQ